MSDTSSNAQTGMTCISCKLMFADGNKFVFFFLKIFFFCGSPIQTFILLSFVFTNNFFVFQNLGASQRHHYRSDFHRYNLKRKVVGLPPVTEQLFNEKVAGSFFMNMILKCLKMILLFFMETFKMIYVFFSFETFNF